MPEKFKYYDEQTGAYIETVFDHVRLPDSLEAPVIDGIERTMNLGITRAPGWHYADGGMLFIPAYRKVSGQSLSFKISFMNKEGKMNKEGLVFEFSSSRSFKSKIPLADIFTVVFGISDPDQIRSLVGHNSELLTSRYLRKKSPDALLRSIKHEKLRNAVDLSNKLRTMLTTQTMIDSPDRFYDLFSVRHFAGCSLGESMEIGNVFYPKFTVIDQQLLFAIEHSGLDSITILTTDHKKIELSLLPELYCTLSRESFTPEEEEEFYKKELSSNDFEFKGKFYSKMGVPKENTLSVYCAVINRLFAFNIAGINFSMQDYRNQKIVTFRDKVEDFARADLELVENKIMTTTNLLEGVSGHRFDITRAERLIKNEDSALAVITKNENPIAKTSQGNTLVRDVEHLSREAVQVLSQDLGLTDPVDSTESKNIGKSTPLTITTERGEDGSLYTPLYKVIDGMVTKEVEKVHVVDLPNLFVAEAGTKLEGNVLAKHRGVVKLFPSMAVTHVRVSPFSTTSVCRATSVFMENTDQKRTQMTANAQRQARTILRAKRALIETGIESIAANGDTGLKHIFTAKDIFESNGVDIEGLDTHTFRIDEISDTGMSKEYRLTSVQDKSKFAIFFITTEKSPHGSSYFYELVAPSNLEVDYKFSDVVYKQHNIVLGGNVESTDRLDYHTSGNNDYFNLSLSNGLDLFVMVGFSESFTVDDASVLNDRLVRDMSFATPVLVTKKFKKGKIFNKDIVEKFGLSSGVVREGYNSDGLPLMGTSLRPGTIWLYKHEINNADGSIVAKNLRLSDSEYGEVIAFENNKEEIKVTLAKWVQVEVGDKSSARHGNKTIIARVVPMEQMPYHPETGRHVDIIINPHSIPSRSNISQLGEMQAGAEVYDKGLTSKVIPPFSNELMDMIKNHENGKGLTELQLINSKTGLYYPKKHFCGYMHYLRSVLIAEDKHHAIGDSSEIDMAFLQPVGGTELHEKGQSISSMEKEILVSYGADGILDEIHSVMSSDRSGYNSVSAYFIDNPEEKSISRKGYNIQAESMQHAALAFHTSMKQDGDNIAISYMDDSDMESFVEMDLKQVDYYLTSKEFQDTMMYIPLPTKFITPTAIRKFKFTSIVPVTTINYDGNASYGWLGTKALENIISESYYFSIRDGGRIVPSITIYPADLSESVLAECAIEHRFSKTGMIDLVNFLEEYPLELWVESFENSYPGCMNKEGVFQEALYHKLNVANSNLKQGGFSKYITARFPVLPNKYRQAKNEVNSKDSLSAAYKDIVRLTQDVSRNSSACSRLYNRMGELLLPSKTGANRLSLFEFFAKKDLDGKIRGKILKTRVVNSMRSTIVPMFSGDPKKYGYPEFAGHPDSIGLPLIGALRIAQPRVLGYMTNHHPDIIEGPRTAIDRMSKVIDILTLPIDSVAEITGWAIDTVAARVKSLKKELIDYVNGSLVFYGRAPSLQETSLRGGRVYIHEEKVIHLHSLLTTDLNADHDGDQIYVAMPVTTNAIQDIEEKLLPSTNALRYNDGVPSLLISQDALLGLFFATQEATSDVVRPISSIDQLKYHIELQLINFNDLVSIHINNEVYVQTTAGRLLVHNIIFGMSADNFVKVDDGTYTVKFNTTVSNGEGGISTANLQLEISKIYNGSSKLVTDIYNSLQQLGYQAVEIRNLTMGIGDLTPILKVESVNKEIKKYIESARTLEELGLLPDDYLLDLDRKVNDLISDLDIMSNIPDDNSFKILAVSGAKGKKAGIEKMFGVIGFVEGNNGKKLETPILSNIVLGLSQFQVEDLSYTQRDNAISTVFETSKPGEALRTGAFELSGLIIQEDSSLDKIPQYCYYVKKPAELIDKETGARYIGQSDKVWVGKTRATAVEIESSEEYHYKGQELSYDLVRQLLGCTTSQLKLDEEDMYLFFDVELHPFAKSYFNNKVGFDGSIINSFKMSKLMKELPTHLPIATHANEFGVEYGITRSHAGVRLGSRHLYQVGENVGIKSSTATAQPANQLVISKRNMERAGGLDNGIDLFKAAVQSTKFYNGNHLSYELLCPEDGIISSMQSDVGTHITLQGASGKTYSHLVKANEEHLFHFLFKEGDMMFMGQTVYTPTQTTDGERPVSPILSFTWKNTTVDVVNDFGRTEQITFVDSLIDPTEDLVQMIRFYFMVYLESIYRINKINLDPNHYGAFALQASRFCTVLRNGASSSEVAPLGYLNLKKYFHEIKDNYPGVVVKMELTKGSDTILLTAGPVAAICYRNAITVSAKAASLGSLPEFGSISKVALGVNLREPVSNTKLFREERSKYRMSVIDLEEKGEEVKYELTQEEEEQAFGDIDWGEGMDDIFGETKTTTPDTTTDKTISEDSEKTKVIGFDASDIFGG